MDNLISCSEDSSLACYVCKGTLMAEEMLDLNSEDYWGVFSSDICSSGVIPPGIKLILSLISSGSTWSKKVLGKEMIIWGFWVVSCSLTFWLEGACASSACEWCGTSRGLSYWVDSEIFDPVPNNLKCLVPVLWLGWKWLWLSLDFVANHFDGDSVSSCISL